MQSNKPKSVQMICNILFIIVLVFTIVIWSVSLGVEVKNAQATDDIWGSNLTVEIGLIPLIIVITVETTLFLCAKHLFKKCKGIKS